jgi:hypothetical protein
MIASHVLLVTTQLSEEALVVFPELIVPESTVLQTKSVREPCSYSNPLFCLPSLRLASQPGSSSSSCSLLPEATSSGCHAPGIHSFQLLGVAHH